MTTALPFGPDHGFGLYIHWPYCSKICPYCDFNVYAAKARDNAPLVQALSADLARHARVLDAHPALGSVYFGGGTPSLMAAGDMALLIAEAERDFGLVSGAEVTLEANPNDVLKADLAAWKDAGINRLSIGVQSLDDAALSFLGRDHDGANARRAVDLALEHFDDVSIDLIYARPGQSASSWQAELEVALAIGAPHLSLYELTIEERTAFGKRAARGELIPMDDDAQADLYELTQQVCEARGLPAYEVSNHARSTAYHSHHNLTYWRGGDWIGLGPGAHGRLTIDGERLATHAPRKPADYRTHVETAADLGGEKLSALDTARELLALGLRHSEGLDLKRIEALTGEPLPAEPLQDLQENGLIQLSGSRLSLTKDGRLLADRITSKLAP